MIAGFWLRTLHRIEKKLTRYTETRVHIRKNESFYFGLIVEESFGAGNERPGLG